MIYSTANSNVTVATTGAPSGMLTFADNGYTVNNLTVNVTGFNGKVMLGSDLYVTGNLAFTSGSLDAGNNTLYIEQGGNITGASASSYVITGDSGKLAMHLTAGAATTTHFPVGTGTHYAPAWVQLNQGSASGLIMANVLDSVRQQGDTGSVMNNTSAMVNATWNISSDISSNLNLALTLLWSASMELSNFNRDSAYISHYTNGSWDNQVSNQTVGTSGTLYSATRTGITDLSPFAVFSRNMNTSIPNAQADFKTELYPNPVADVLLVKTNMKTENTFLEITNMDGQLVKRSIIKNVETAIPVQELNAGNYVVKIYNRDGNTVSRLIKL